MVRQKHGVLDAFRTVLGYGALFGLVAFCAWFVYGFQLEMQERDDEVNLGEILHPNAAVVRRVVRYHQDNGWDVPSYFAAGMGMVLYNERRLSQAAPWFRQALRDYDNKPPDLQVGTDYLRAVTHLYLGKVLAAQDRMSEARHEWREAEQSRPFPQPDDWHVVKEPVIEAAELLLKDQHQVPSWLARHYVKRLSPAK
jgi:hypothetical protein